MKSSSDTSWQKAGPWQNTYYNDHIIVPGVLRLLHISVGDSLLDLGCGPAAIAGKIPDDVRYVGVDSAQSFIVEAKQQDKNPRHQFIVSDATKPLSVTGIFSHATIILALQNMEEPHMAIENAARYLDADGQLVIVLNHPAFRIPRQSAWGIDEGNKLEYRRVNRYMSALKIPVNMHPGSERGPVTWSFHRPISFYANLLTESGFVIERMEEWTSDKESAGKAAKMENRARSEFPLFLAVSARLDS